jgi:hypothetical protein
MFQRILECRISPARRKRFVEAASHSRRCLNVFQLHLGHLNCFRFPRGILIPLDGDRVALVAQLDGWTGSFNRYLAIFEEYLPTQMLRLSCSDLILSAQHLSPTRLIVLTEIEATAPDSSFPCTNI